MPNSNFYALMIVACPLSAVIKIAKTFGVKVYVARGWTLEYFRAWKSCQR